jgi:hypothetical protein
MQRCWHSLSGMADISRLKNNFANVSYHWRCIANERLTQRRGRGPFKPREGTQTPDWTLLLLAERANSRQASSTLCRTGLSLSGFHAT